MATKKPSAAQLAARKKFAAMAKARAKDSKKKAAPKRKKKVAAAKKSAKPVKRKATKTKRIARPMKKPEHFYIVAVVDGKRYYYDGGGKLGPKSKAMPYDKDEVKKIAVRVSNGLKYHEGITAERVTTRKK